MAAAGAATERSTADPVSPRDPVRHLDTAARDRIAALSSQLFDLDAAALDLAAATHRRLKPLELVLAIVDRAGRPVPPGLSKARAAQRRLRADEARDWIARELADDAGRATVTEALDLALRRQPGEPTAASRGITVQLTTAAMGVVASLDLSDHAPALAAWLALDAAPPLRSAARTNLFEMYGRWFELPADFEAVWVALRGRTPIETGRDELLAAHGIANERALALIEFAPERVGHDLVDWRDPSMGARAARAVGRAVASDRLKPDAARELLLEGLADERRPPVLHARLETLLDLIQGVEPESLAAGQVRDVVAGLLARIEPGSANAAWTVMGGLPRLPHAVGPEGDASRAAALGLGVGLFDSVLHGADVRVFDPDALQGAINALVDLARSIENEELRKSASRPLCDLVRPFVLDADAAPVRVRRASAVAFGLSVRPDDAEDLVRLVSQMRTRELEYELLGALKASIAVLEPGSAGSESVVEALFHAAAEPDFDSRKRAIELLLSEDVGPALDAVDRATRARWVASSLLAEQAPELRAKRLDLLARIGDRDALALLVRGDTQPSGSGAGPSKPSPIEELAASGEQVTEALADATITLARDDQGLRMGIARDLVGPDPVDRMQDPLTVVRRREGLRVALVGSDEAARSLEAEDHRFIVGLALELRHAAPALARELFFVSGAGVRLKLHGDRLAETAGPAEPEGLPLDASATATLAALLSADRLRAPLAGESTNEVERAREIDATMARFEAAAAQLAALPTGLHGWTASDLRLDGIDFLRTMGQLDQAHREMERLLDGGKVQPADLPGSTLRSFVELIESRPVPTEAQLQRALRLRLEVIRRRKPWAADDAGLRLDDLESATSLAVTAGDPTLRGDVVALLQDLLTDGEGNLSPMGSELSTYDAGRTEALMAAIESLSPSPAPEVPDDAPDEAPDKAPDDAPDEGGQQERDEDGGAASAAGGTPAHSA